MGSGLDPFRHKARAAAPPDQGVRLHRTLTRLRARTPSWTSLALPLLFLVAGAVVLSRKLHRDSRPEVTSLKAAGRYLEALKRYDFETAYALLTQGSKEACGLEDFKRIRPSDPWNFHSLRLVSVQGDRATFSYALETQGRPPKQESLALLREGERWLRPFLWPLLDKAEDALSRKDSGTALLLAKAARRIDPDDPSAQAYVCEAAYDNGPPEEAERECHDTLFRPDSRTRPRRVPIPPDSERRLRMLLANAALRLEHCDTAIHALSIDGSETAALRAPPLAGDADFAATRSGCGLLFAVADCRAQNGDFNGALRDLRFLDKACPQGRDASAVRQALRVLSGEAGSDAVLLAQNQPVSEDGPTLLEWRDSMRLEAAGEPGSKRRRSGRPKDRWTAAYSGKGEYQVDLAADGSTLLSARVDLWTPAVQQIRAQNQ